LRLIALLCLVAACACKPIPNRGNPRVTPTAQIFTYLALGDSYTIGEGVPAEQRWPMQLAGLLSEEGYALSEPRIVARTGWTTGELDAAIRQEELSKNYDLVSLLIGVNNQYRGYSPEDYRQEFTDLLEQAIAFAGADPRGVLVLSIPDWSVTPYAQGRDQPAIAAAIDTFNLINREETERRGVSYIDVTPASRQATEDITLIAPDGLHPSGKMYAEWARLALSSALQALKSGQ
jgi:lysophospholipase L1-like esterase